jgi:hypothetical protein
VVTVRYKVDNAWRAYTLTTFCRPIPRETGHDTGRSSRAAASDAGYSLAEFLISMGIMTVVMGATMGGLAGRHQRQ